MFDSGGQLRSTSKHSEQREAPVKLPFGGRNVLIHGDNDRALDTVAEEIKSSVQCVYIDPPYNNLKYTPTTRTETIMMYGLRKCRRTRGG